MTDDIDASDTVSTCAVVTRLAFKVTDGRLMLISMKQVDV